MSKEAIEIIHIAYTLFYELIYISFLLVALYVMCMVIIGKIEINIKIIKKEKKEKNENKQKKK